MLSSLSRARRTDHTSRFLSQATEIQELETLPAELQGVCAWELDGYPEHDISQENHVLESAQDRSAYPQTENHGDPRCQPMPRPFSGGIALSTSQPQAPMEVIEQTCTSPHLAHEFMSMSGSADISPIQEGAFSTASQHLPPVTTATYSSSTQSDAMWPTRVSPTISPIGLVRWDNEDNPRGRYMAGQNDVRERHQSSLSAAVSFPPYRFSHSSGYKQHGMEAPSTVNNQLFSPVSTRRNSSSKSPDLSSALPTPPVGSPPNTDNTVSPRERQCYTLGFPVGDSSPPSHLTTGLASPVSPTVTDDTFGSLNSRGQHVQSFEQPTYWGRNQTSTSQLQRIYGSEMYMLLIPHDDNASNEFEEALPTYSPGNAGCSPEYEAAAFQISHGQAPVTAEDVQVKTMSGKRKRGSIRDGCATFFGPLSCGLCEAVFNGQYQKGNRNRHIKLAHSAPEVVDESGKTCRECGHVYRRADARRKHEWKKHRIADARPEKRRKEKRIYMPVID